MHVCYEYQPTTTLALCNHKRTTNIETTNTIKGLKIQQTTYHKTQGYSLYPMTWSYIISHLCNTFVLVNLWFMVPSYTKYYLEVNCCYLE